MSVQKSGWHQGKGSRRWPIFTSAGRRQKYRGWGIQARHRVELVNLMSPLSQVEYKLPAGKTADEAIYLFDQEAAQHGFLYGITIIHHKYHSCFGVIVEKTKEALARQSIAKLNPPRLDTPFVLNSYARRRERGYWRSVLTPKRKDMNGWHVALYSEQASKRDDGHDYIAFLFRNEARTQFGIEEFLGDAAKEAQRRESKWRQMAQQVCQDDLFRERLLSDDPDLPKMWRHH